MKRIKTIDYYMSLPYRLEIIPDCEEGGYGARYPELPGCITCGETLETVTKNAMDAKREWLLSAIEDGANIPEPAATEDANQYCMYLLSRNDAQHGLTPLPLRWEFFFALFTLH